MQVMLAVLLVLSAGPQGGSEEFRNFANRLTKAYAQEDASQIGAYCHDAQLAMEYDAPDNKSWHALVMQCYGYAEISERRRANACSYFLHAEALFPLTPDVDGPQQVELVRRGQAETLQAILDLRCRRHS